MAILAKRNGIYVDDMVAYSNHIRENMISFDNGYKRGYNEAVDKLVKEICNRFTQEERNGNLRFCACEIKQSIADLGEQLKAGITND